MKSDAENSFFCHPWARVAPSLFSSVPENTGVISPLLPVILGSVCSDFSICNYYKKSAGEIVTGPTDLTET